MSRVCLSASGRRQGCVAARRSGRAVGGAVEGGVDVVWTAGGALVGGAVEASVIHAAGDGLIGGAVEGGVADAAGGAVAGGTRGGDPWLWMVRQRTRSVLLHPDKAPSRVREVQERRRFHGGGETQLAGGGRLWRRWEGAGAHVCGRKQQTVRDSTSCRDATGTALKRSIRVHRVTRAK
ncbi:hypothetical protein GGX14DRAFT_403330 [Mycena pura]|uniref:Uncharacterized protein n=1 Tax=Mycena pura TaxID=153505 RepID=A0AAD6UY49_9AGAR|nr:hypothetical protein GGX14DRAFT_403330 [Mycena pura]